MNHCVLSFQEGYSHDSPEEEGEGGDSLKGTISMDSSYAGVMGKEILNLDEQSDMIMESHFIKFKLFP